MKPPKFSGDIRDFARFKADFKKIVESEHRDQIHQIYVMKECCLQGKSHDLVRNLDNLSDIWERLTEKYGDTTEIVDSVIKDIQNVTIQRGSEDQGGLIVFVREGLTCNELKPRKLYPELECTFLEIRIRQCKWLVAVGNNPHKENVKNFLDKISKEIDQFLPKYDNLLILGDWNSEVTEEEMVNFCEIYDLENLIKEPTCFKSTGNPSSIDIMLTKLPKISNDFEQLLEKRNLQTL